MTEAEGNASGSGYKLVGKHISFEQALLDILTQQQKLITQVSQQMTTTQECLKELSRDDIALDSLASNIVEFKHDPEQGSTFETWFSRYTDLFKEDANKLDDAAKVRLLMRKLNPAAHERYTSFILPKLPSGFTFDETVAQLKSLFGSPVSVFHRRYQCLQTAKEDSEDILAYSCRVNRACVDFKLSAVSEEQFKCLIFVCGLRSPSDSDIRMRLITRLNEATPERDLTLTKIVEDCRSLVNLKRDNVLVEHPQQSAVHAVKHNNNKYRRPTVSQRRPVGVNKVLGSRVPHAGHAGACTIHRIASSRTTSAGSAERRATKRATVAAFPENLQGRRRTTARRRPSQPRSSPCTTSAAEGSSRRCR